MKRILLLILSLVIVVSGVNVFATETAVSDSGMQQNFAILRSLEIADWTEDGTITRAEFVKIVMNLVLGEDIENYGNYKSPFPDVDENTKYRNEIVAAHSFGIVSGNGQTFRPNDSIGYAEAIKILVHILGYDIQAQAKGGYPAGYIAQASSLGIRGYSSIDILTKSECAKVLLDALDVRVSEVFYRKTEDGVIDKVYVSEGGDSLLYTTKGIYKTTGVVKNNGLSGLTSTDTYGKDRTVIGNVVYRNNFAGMRDLLGYNVYAYIKDNKENTDDILYAYEFGNNTLAVFDEEYIDFANGVLEYETASGSVREADIPGDAPVIYNNMVVDIYTDADFDIKNGSISLIDNNRDHVYDVVKIDSYTDYFVLSASSDSCVVIDAYNPEKTVKLDSSDDAEIIILNKSGLEAGFDDIGENSVLTVAASKDGKYVKCYLSNDMVSGYVKKLKINDDDKSIAVDDVEYKVSKTANATALNKVKIGCQYAFYLNINGEVVGYKEDVRSSEFAYLIGARDNDEIFDKRALFKLLLSNGSFVTVKAKKVYYVDGYKCENATIPAILGTQQVVRIKMNAEMEISHIDTIATGASGSDFNALVNFGEMAKKTYWSRGVCEGGIVVPDNIVIFSVPEASEGSMEEKDFEVKTRAELTAGKKTMQLFNAKENSYVPQVMVLANAGAPQVSASANTGLVTSIEKTLSSDEEVIDRIGLLNSVGEAYYDCKIPDLATVKGVEEGDIIAYELDSKNRITAINIIVDYNKVNSRSSVLRTDTDVTNLTSPNRSYDATFRVRFGNVYAKEGNVITISDTLEDNLARSEVESFTASTSMIYKVEQVRGSVATSLIKVGDIKDYIHFNDESHMVFVFFQSTAPKMIVVYE